MLSVQGEECAVEGSAAQLDEMLRNLMDNAIRYNVRGGDVTVLVRPQDTDCLVRVSDTGVGIAKEHQARVFERFYRVDKSHSRETGGTGLGLSIVKHCVQNHGGAITVQSDAEGRTVMTVMLPADGGRRQFKNT